MCVGNEAPPFLFIGQGHPVLEAQSAPKHPGRRLGPMREQHVEGQDERTQGRFGQSKDRPIPLGHVSPCAFSEWLAGGSQRWFQVYVQF